MDLLQICALSILGAVAAISLKTFRPELSFLCGLAVCLLMFGTIVMQYSDVLVQFYGVTKYMGAEGRYLKLLCKMIGITYLCEFCSSICKDAGQNAIAGQVEVWGKLCIMATGIPVICSVIECIRDLTW